MSLTATHTAKLQNAAEFAAYSQVRKRNSMAFVSELIPEEEKSKLDFESYRTHTGQSADLWKWCVDRERGAYLINLGSHGPDADKLFAFTLTWQGKVTRFLGLQEATGEITKGCDVAWNVYDIRIPEEFQQTRTLVLRMIEEALDAYGLYGNRAIVKSLNIKIR